MCACGEGEGDLPFHRACVFTAWDFPVVREFVVPRCGQKACTQLICFSIGKVSKVLHSAAFFFFKGAGSSREGM